MIKRKLVTFITIIVAILLQTTIFRKLALSDVVPNLLLVETVTSGLYLRQCSGALCLCYDDDRIYHRLLSENLFSEQSGTSADPDCRKRSDLWNILLCHRIFDAR